MPATSGWATRSSASRPSRRRTNAPRLSSAAPPRGSTRSSAIRSFRPGEEGRAQEWREPRRREELESIGQRVEPAGAPDVDLAEPIVGASEAVLDAEPLA